MFMSADEKPGDEDPLLRAFLARARDAKPAASGVAQPSGRVISLDELGARAPIAETSTRWSYAALRGRLVELSARGASGTLTSAMALVVEAQAATEPVCWVTLANASFYPPDAADSGVDLAGLVVVRAPDLPRAVRAAERVLRSGAFGLLVIDFGRGELADDALSMANQGRLVTLAQHHDAAVVCLTEKSADAASLGSLISLRIEALREGPGGIRIHALKDKKRGPGWMHRIRKLKSPMGT
jgi:recombination protein RecA